MKKFYSLLLLSLVLTGCSTYKTSNNDILFSRPNIDQQPLIPVGELPLENDQYTFLGWVEAYVQKPAVWKPNATEEQAKFILSYAAQEQDADAVIHISYREKFNYLGLRRLIIRGQAIKLAPEFAAKLNEQATQTEVLKDKESLIEPTNETVQAAVSEIAIEPDAVIEKPVELSEEALPVVQDNIDTSAIDEILAQQPPENPAPFTGDPVTVTSAAVIIRKKTEEVEEVADACFMFDANESLDEQINETQLMINNAHFLAGRLKKHKDKEALDAVGRLIILLQKQQAFLEASKPATELIEETLED